jgi:hypothetical protein
MKKLLSLTVLAALLVTPFSTAYAKDFTDLGADNPNYLAIQYLAAIGTIQGYSDDTFRPDQTVNRAELLKLLVSGQGIEPDEVEFKDCFSDVLDDWYAKYVCYASDQGWVEGYSDGTFRPDQTVNKVEALKMVIESLGFDYLVFNESPQLPFSDTETDSWYAPYLTAALMMNLTEEQTGNYAPADGMSRSTTAEYIYRGLVALEMNSASFSEDLEYWFWVRVASSDLDISDILAAVDAIEESEVQAEEGIIQTVTDQSEYEGFKFKFEVPWNSDDAFSDVYHMSVKGDLVSGSRYIKNNNSGVEEYSDSMLSLDGYDEETHFLSFYYGWYTYPSIQVDFNVVDFEGTITDSGFTTVAGTLYDIEFLPIYEEDNFPKKDCLIKGDNSYLSSSQNIYYLESDTSYSEIKYPVEWFCSEDEATAAGYVKALE